MSEWKEVIVEDIKAKSANALSTGPFGSAISSQFFVKQGIPVIRGSNLSADTSKRLIENDFAFLTEEKAKEFARSKTKIGDLIFTCWGTINQIGLIDNNSKYPEYIISNKQMKLSPDPEKADSLFLYYLFSSNNYQNQILGNNIGSSVPGFNLGQLRNMSMLLPSLDEQKAIVSVLSSLDDKIDLLHRQNKTLEAMAETLFRQWFVEEAEESWEEKSLTTFIATTLGGEWGKENPEGEYVIETQCIRGTDIADLETGIPLRTPTRFIKQRKFESIEIQDGDLVMEISGGTDNQSTGRTTYINRDVKSFFPNHLIFSNFCRLIRPKKAEFSFFLYSFIHYLYKQGELFNLENGSSGIKNLNYKALLFDLKFRLPEEKKVVKYNIDVSNYFNKINKNKIQILTLMKLRDDLLPKLMSGELAL